MADLHRIIADALLEADGYDPEVERDPEGSGPGDCVRVAEARADRVIEALGGDSDPPLTGREAIEALLESIETLGRRIASS